MQLSTRGKIGLRMVSWCKSDKCNPTAQLPAPRARPPPAPPPPRALTDAPSPLHEARLQSFFWLSQHAGWGVTAALVCLACFLGTRVGACVYRLCQLWQPAGYRELPKA